MRICHIITRLILGGAQQNTVETARAQREAGHDVHLAFGPIYGPEGSWRDAAAEAGIVLHELGWLRRAIVPVHDWAAYVQMVRLVKRIRPDVVHTHSSKAGILGRLAARRCGVGGVIHTIHGLPFHDRQPAAVRWAYVQLERWAAGRCDKLVGLTQAMCDAFLSRGIGTREQFAVAPSGVDPGPFVLEDAAARARERAAVRSRWGVADDAKVVGILARLDPHKGQADLLSVTPELAGSHPSLRIVLAGDGWHRSKLESQAASLGIGDRVHFAGLVPYSEAGGVLRAMDVMVLPSYQEGQGRSLVESLLAGTPIVCYDAGGMPEVCVDGRTGRCVPTGDRSALAEAIDGLLSDPAEANRLASAGRAHALERFTVKAMVDRLDSIYAEVLAGGRGG